MRSNFIQGTSLFFVKLLLGSLLIAGPVSAQEKVDESAAEAIDFDTLSFEEAAQLYTEGEMRWATEPCSFGVPIIAILEKGRPGVASIRKLSLSAQIYCADEERRFADAIAITRAFNTEFPDTPQIWLMLFLAQRTDDADLAFEAFGLMEGERFKVLDRELYGFNSRTIHQAGRGDELDALILTWFDDRQIGFIDTALHETFARRALAGAVREGRSELAPKMLNYITSPTVYVDLLTDREFESIWPQIEERVGPNLETVGSEDVRIARNRLALGASDRDRFSDAAFALHYHGEFQEAIELAERWRTREERGLGLEEGDGWALNIQAYAYDSLGEVEKADAVFDQLAGLDPDEHPWVVNFVINRASRLVGQGRWKEGLEAAKLARSVAETKGSPFAQMIVAKDHACALYQLGQSDKAAQELVFMRENARESVSLAALAYLCLGMRDEAAEILTKGLDDPVTRGPVLSALAKPELDLFYTSSMLPKARSLMDDYPKLKEAFYRSARDLPESLIPRASLLRAELDLPAWEER